MNSFKQIVLLGSFLFVIVSCSKKDLSDPSTPEDLTFGNLSIGKLRYLVHAG